MAAASWWLDAVRPELSQGDVLDRLPFAIPVIPVIYLQKQTGKGGLPSWFEHTTPQKEKDGRSTLLSKGLLAPGIVVSHDCDLDKHADSRRVLVAPLQAWSAYKPDTQARIDAQKTVALGTLPEIPNLGRFVPDLRCIASIPREVVNAATRVASLTDDARDRFMAQLFVFFFRKTLGPEPLA